MSFDINSRKATDSKKQQALPDGFSPGANDVIVGRGKKCYNHVGNQALNKIVCSKLNEYSIASYKFSKSSIISSIVTKVRANGGGFVKEGPATGHWFDVGDVLARKKVAQTFRDALHEKYSSSYVVKNSRRRQGKKPKNTTKNGKLESPKSEKSAKNDKSVKTEKRTKSEKGAHTFNVRACSAQPDKCMSIPKIEEEDHVFSCDAKVAYAPVSSRTFPKNQLAPPQQANPPIIPQAVGQLLPHPYQSAAFPQLGNQLFEGVGQDDDPFEPIPVDLSSSIDNSLLVTYKPDDFGKFDEDDPFNCLGT